MKTMPILETLAEVIGGIGIHMAAEHLITNQRAFKSALTHSVVYRSRRIRVSMAQILSIQMDNKYVLIANAKRPERVTPIGGVVHYFPSETDTLEGKIGFKHELKNAEERYDLRGYILGKHFVPFLRWYATGSGREQNALAREIEEELSEIGASRVERYVRRPEFVRARDVHEGPSPIRGGEYWQYRFFEVYTLQEESAISKALAGFIRKEARKSPNLALATTDEIRAGRLADGRIVGDSAGYLFSNSLHGVVPGPWLQKP
jgi:SMODS-associated NUDIX domain